MKSEEYMAGRCTGVVIASLRAGVRNMSATWPELAHPADKEEVEEWCRLTNLKCEFKDRWVTIKEREPPDLRVVN